MLIELVFQIRFSSYSEAAPCCFSPNFQLDADFFERNGQNIEFRLCDSYRCSKANLNKTITTDLLKSNAHQTRKKGFERSKHAVSEENYVSFGRCLL